MNALSSRDYADIVCTLNVDWHRRNASYLARILISGMTTFV